MPTRPTKSWGEGALRIALAACGALGLVGCADPRWHAPRLTIEPESELGHVRVFVDPEVKVTWSDEDCAPLAKALGADLRQHVLDGLSRAGFATVPLASGERDVLGTLKVDFSLCSPAMPGLVGKATLVTRPGAVVWAKFSGVDSPGERLAKLLRDAQPIRALAARRASPRNDAEKTSGGEVAARVPRTRAPAAAAESTASTAPPSPGRPVFAAGATQRSTYALVVGVERYRDLPPIAGVGMDTRRFARLARETLGAPEANVRMAVDDRASRSDIEKELEWLRVNVPQNGRIIFYFAGHGAPQPTDGSTYLVPYDGDPKYIERTGLSVQAVLDALGRTRADEVIAIVDACFSGAGGRSVLPEGARPITRTKETQVHSRVTLFSAASGAEIAGPVPGGQGGLFTKWVVEGLGSARADLDGDAQISARELAQWVTPRVARDARHDNREQTPQLVEGADAPDMIVATGLQPP